jgi:hypothetical protein
MSRFISHGSATPVDDFTESRMKFGDPTKPPQEMGHPWSIYTGKTPKKVTPNCDRK